MKKNLVAFLGILLISGLSSCHSQSKIKEKILIELDKPEILEEHKLSLPTGAISLNVAKVFEIEGKPYLFVRTYPFNSLFVYNLTTDSLVKEINIPNLSLIDIDLINNDNILLYDTPQN